MVVKYISILRTKVIKVATKLYHKTRLFVLWVDNKYLRYKFSALDINAHTLCKLKCLIFFWTKRLQNLQKNCIPQKLLWPYNYYGMVSQV